jgi:hypothetical protein
MEAVASSTRPREAMLAREEQALKIAAEISERCAIHFGRAAEQAQAEGRMERAEAFTEAVSFCRPRLIVTGDGAES